jgi:hypothetical protein
MFIAQALGTSLSAIFGGIYVLFIPSFEAEGSLEADMDLAEYAALLFFSKLSIASHSMKKSSKTLSRHLHLDDSFTFTVTSLLLIS